MKHTFFFSPGTCCLDTVCSKLQNKLLTKKLFNKTDNNDDDDDDDDDNDDNLSSRCLPE